MRGAVHLEHVIQQMDFAVDKVPGEEDALAALAVNGYDLLIIDIDSLDQDAGACLRKARATDAGLRLFVLAGRERMEAIAAALEQGADDFLIKPIDPAELRLRVSHLSRRRSDKGTATVLECGPLRLQVSTGEVSLDGKAVEITPRERAVLQILLRESGNVVAKDYIASRIFSMDNDATPTAIETYVSRLRRKLSHPHIHIRTVHGLGYLLARTPAVVAAALAILVS
jgi:DNA-binding response OmpR family regulator